MKKFITFILALLYLGSSNGATIHLHYCMGEVAGWGLTERSSNTCGKCGMEKIAKKANDCCKDEMKFIKNDSDQKTSGGIAFTFLSLEPFIAVPAFTNFIAPLFSSLTEENPTNNAPPRGLPVATYILHSSFLI